MVKKDFFPDGTPIDNWFYEETNIDVVSMGKEYCLTDYGIKDDGRIYTKKIQALIDTISNSGGGVLVVPRGTFLTGALFFKRKVNLFIKKGGVIKGSDDISDYPVCDTRIEGENCRYFPALINADSLDGFKMFGEGTIDGNGKKSWKAFWTRREWNPDCTNKDEQRPRLVFLSNCTNIVISGIALKNSHFWTAHFYKCRYVKVLNCSFYSPRTPVAAPSTDAIDIDVCSDLLIKNCLFDVNDDAVALKGGKGLFADKKPENGTNERIIAEDCVYEYCHGCLTCGSESVHNKNIIVRRITVKHAINLLWLKMRPDTPQCYEYISMEDVKGRVRHFLNANSWTQFFASDGKSELPLSYSSHIIMKNCKIECDICFNVMANDAEYVLSDFCFQNLQIKARKMGDIKNAVKNLKISKISESTRI